jgi:hypothetical protein
MKVSNALRARVHRAKMKKRKTEKDWEGRVIFRVPKENQGDFLSLKRVGYGDTEIVVECLKVALPEVKRTLLALRAQEAQEELATLTTAAASGHPQGVSSAKQLFGSGPSEQKPPETGRKQPRAK